MKDEKLSANVNVTLPQSSSDQTVLFEKEFPCPFCGAGLPILTSKREKPYMVCNPCGVQIFVRGKTGIARLNEMADAGILVSSRKESAMHGIRLYNRLEQLKLQKRDLDWKRGIIFRDESVENAIQIIETEIDKVESELRRFATKAERV